MGARPCVADMVDAVPQTSRCSANQIISNVLDELFHEVQIQIHRFDDCAHDADAVSLSVNVSA